MGTARRDEQVAAWAASGALALTGRAGRPPLGPPGALLDLLDETARRIARGSRRHGREVRVDGYAVLAERAAISGLRRNGSTSCGGASRLFRTADGWLVATLARPDDLDLLPAWLGIDPPAAADDPWPAVLEAATLGTAEDLSASGAELGLPVAAVGSTTPAAGPPVIRTAVGKATPLRLEDVVVVDLSSLWAGPLCGRILVEAGATVIKVESSRRPDGARSGAPRFFDLMNSGKRSVAVDFTAPHGRQALHRLLASADVVIEASRPRALAALGIDAPRVTATGPQVWLSITAFGRSGPEGLRVGFGDDAAAAGGAVVCDAYGPCFLADALADPLAGLVGAAAVLDALADGGRHVVDVAMARVAAAVAGPRLDVGCLSAAPPADPVARGAGPPLGADTDDVLASLVP